MTKKTKSARELTNIGTALGGVAWVLGFFTYFGLGQLRGIYIFFLLVTAVELVLFRKTRAVSQQAEGDPLKKGVTISLVCFVVQLVFFLALVAFGPANVPGASSLFFCFTAIYLLCPALVNSTAKRLGV